MTNRAYLFDQRTDKCYLALVTITSNKFKPIRVVNNTENITSTQGHVFRWFPFDIEIPADSADEIPKIHLVIQDPTREIAPQIRQLTSAPTITLCIVTSDNPDENNPEDGPYTMTLKNCLTDSLTITGELGYEDIWDEPYPGDVFSPYEYPGLF